MPVLPNSAAKIWESKKTNFGTLGLKWEIHYIFILNVLIWIAKSDQSLEVH